jgi:hypothetical protein
LVLGRESNHLFFCFKKEEEGWDGDFRVKPIGGECGGVELSNSGSAGEVEIEAE